MDKFTIGEMQEMQKVLQEKYKDKWEPICAEIGQNKLLWMIGEVLHVKKVLKPPKIFAILRKTQRLELRECALLLANDLGIHSKAAFVSLGFAVPEMQEVRILSA